MIPNIWRTQENTFETKKSIDNNVYASELDDNAQTWSTGQIILSDDAIE